MRRAFLAAAALPFALVTAPAVAQDAEHEIETQQLDRLGETLADPDKQREVSLMLVTLSEVLLDLPLAPILTPLAEIAGEDPDTVDPDASLRTMSPNAEYLAEDIEDAVPQAMDRMASFSAGLSVLIPALRDMAKQFGDVLPDARDDYAAD